MAFVRMAVPSCSGGILQLLAAEIITRFEEITLCNVVRLISVHPVLNALGYPAHAGDGLERLGEDKLF